MLRLQAEFCGAFVPIPSENDDVIEGVAKRPTLDLNFLANIFAEAANASLHEK
jgi:hypothetical protein